MITATTWVRRGVAAQFPTKYDIDEDEINRISKLARLQLEDAQGDLKAAESAGNDEDDDDDDAMDDDEEEEGEKAGTGSNKGAAYVLA
jgi:periodic tryptophan protein 1